MASEYVLHVKRGEAYDESGVFCVPDSLDIGSASAFARKMARYSLGAREVGTGGGRASKIVDLYEVLGIADAGSIDVARAWAATRSGPPLLDDDGEYQWGRDWLRFPIGVNPETGEPVVIDLKETDQFDGMGQHVVVIGTSGSGKSVLLTALITSACLTHSPESLKVAVFDFKGSALAINVAGFPHVVAAQNNLRNDLLWLKRMDDVLYGEMETRKRLLDRAGVSEIAEYEYLRIHQKEKLRPIPHLLLVVDEFTQMFAQHEGAEAVMDEVARQGRSLGLRLVMGSQRLDNQMQRGIMSNIAVRVALRTVGDTDSYQLLGSHEANHLPKKPAGAGLLKVGASGSLTRFQTAFPLRGYVPPQQVSAAAARAEVGYVAPQEFLAVGMSALEVPVGDAQVRVVEPRALVGEDGRTVKQVQATIASLKRLNLPALKPMWLPPLAPLPVDELVRRWRGKPWDVDYGGAGKDLSTIVFPVGVEDRPFDHRQLVYAPNLADSNCVLVGVLGAGKTVAVTTMISGAALLYSPRRVQFYVIALSGPDLNQVAQLPHVGGFARESDPEMVGRIIAEMLTVIGERERAFAELGLTLAKFRERKFGAGQGPLPNDPFGDVYLIIDGWPTFLTRWERLVEDVQRILAKGPEHGVHVIVSTNGWIIGSKFPSGMSTRFTANVELKLDGDDDHTNNNGKVAKDVPFGERKIFLDDDEEEGGEVEAVEVVKVRGRGTSMDGYHFQAGLPELTLGGQRVDIGAAAEAITKKAGVDSAAAQVRKLPKEIGIDDVFRAWERRGGTGVPFGISEIGLVPAIANFAAAPHLLVTGNPECGLSTALAAVAQAVMRVYRPDEAKIYVVDPHTELLRVVEGEHLGEYVHREDQIRALGERLASILAERMPAGDLSQEELASGVRRWDGPEIFVIVDREETLAGWDRGGIIAGTGHPLEALKGFVPRGKEVGLHLIVSRRIAQWGRVQSNPIVGELLKARSAGVVMDGDPGEGPIIGTTKAAPAPPGRGLYVTDRVVAPVQIARPVNTL